MKDKIVRVSDVMRPNCIIVDGMETVSNALKMMADARADMVVVDRRNENDEYGVVQLTDIVFDVLAPNRPADRINVYEIMKKPVVTIRANMNIRYCARLFGNLGILTAPVIQDKKLVGTVSYRQLAFGGSAAGLFVDGDPEYGR